ncbi:LPXTG cell wall anchor domain-containing protein (plasmid) [Paraburkholderia sp. PREW-6R]|uniref:LPXTG cell wall anchor domain-containing protein n=1 Tax=Paraburkholderia sp. PREW-6R TaxID=3141544 RepID=UPI0031F49C7A
MDATQCCTFPETELAETGEDHMNVSSWIGFICVIVAVALLGYTLSAKRLLKRRMREQMFVAYRSLELREIERSRAKRK